MNKTPTAQNTNFSKHNAQSENTQRKIQYRKKKHKTKPVEPRNIVLKAKHKIISVKIARRNA